MHFIYFHPALTVICYDLIFPVQLQQVLQPGLQQEQVRMFQKMI